jgi:hypothetical protein
MNIILAYQVKELYTQRLPHFPSKIPTHMEDIRANVLSDTPRVLITYAMIVRNHVRELSPDDVPGREFEFSQNSFGNRRLVIGERSKNLNPSHQIRFNFWTALPTVKPVAITRCIEHASNSELFEPTY